MGAGAKLQKARFDGNPYVLALDRGPSRRHIAKNNQTQENHKNQQFDENLFVLALAEGR